jgi:hypothetical protein
MNSIIPIASIIAASRLNATTGKEFLNISIEITPSPFCQMSNIFSTFLLA